MKIETGKFYKTRDGRKVGPMVVLDNSSLFANGSPNGGLYKTWSIRGKAVNYPGGTIDLIAEWTDEPRPWGELTDAEKVELVEAWRDGRPIQYSHIDAGGMWLPLVSPGWHNDTPYRVKPPEPVVETVTLHGAIGVYFTKGDPVHFDTHRITFTTKDGEPDCSSIKMEPIND